MPIADMLTHSPPIPLIIDCYSQDDNVDSVVEEELTLALEQRDPVCRIRLGLPAPGLQRLLMTIDGEYPILEFMSVGTRMEAGMALILPESLHAPQLRHLLLFNVVIPTGSRFLVPSMGLVTFFLSSQYTSTYTDFRLPVLIQWLSSMRQLETLVIDFACLVPNHYVEKQLMYTPITTQVTLPNLRRLVFQGVTAYLDALICRITAPSLEKLGIYFFEPPTLSAPRLLQFINTTEKLKSSSAKFQFFNKEVVLIAYPREKARTYGLTILIRCVHLDQQVSSVAPILDALSRKVSVVEHLTFEHELHSHSSEEHNEVDSTEWRRLLWPFTNSLHRPWVRWGALSLPSTARQRTPFGAVIRAAGTQIPGSGDVDNAFTSFTDARQNIGRPITLARTPESSSFSAPVVTSE